MFGFYRILFYKYLANQSTSSIENGNYNDMHCFFLQMKTDIIGPFPLIVHRNLFILKATQNSQWRASHKRKCITGIFSLLSLSQFSFPVEEMHNIEIPL